MADEVILAEALGEERTKNKALHDQVDDLKREVRRAEIKASGWRFMQFVVGMVVGLGIVAGCGWLVYKSLTGGDTNRCYIERSSTQVEVYMITREVEWGQDRSIGYATDLDKAQEIAKKQGCYLPPERP